MYTPYCLPATWPVLYGPPCKDSLRSHSPVGICKKTHRQFQRRIELLRRQGCADSVDDHHVCVEPGQDSSSTTGIEPWTRSPDSPPDCRLGRPLLDRRRAQPANRGRRIRSPSFVFRHLCDDRQLSDQLEARIPSYRRE